MLTKEEREAIAKRLHECDYLYDNALYQILFGHNVPSDTTFEDDSKAILKRLTDLIDPTCQYLPCACVTWVDDNGEEHEEENLEEPGYSENAYCSVCRYEMMTGEEGWFDYKREEHGNRLIPNFNYCPHCGAEVVRDEA